MPIYTHTSFAGSPDTLNFDAGWLQDITQPKEYKDDDGQQLGITIKLAKRRAPMVFVRDHKTEQTHTITEAEALTWDGTKEKPDLSETMHRGKSRMGSTNRQVGAKAERSRYTTKRVWAEVEGGEFFYRYESAESARLDAVTLCRQTGLALPEWAKVEAAA